jgi:hypothetical protein
MIVVPAKVMPSQIHEYGVFAISPIIKGTVIWFYCYPPDFRIKVIPPEMQFFADRYAYKPIGKDYYEFAGDIAMYINHSSSPNISHLDDGRSIANKDIAIGEELTYNYFEFDSDPESGGKLI